jgi:hypothetical protein
MLEIAVTQDRYGALAIMIVPSASPNARLWEIAIRMAPIISSAPVGNEQHASSVS